MSEVFGSTDLVGPNPLLNVDITEVAYAAANAVAVVGRAREKGRGWLKAGIICLSALGGGTAATITAISAFVGYKAVKPQRRIPAAALESPLLPPQRVYFNSADGLLINGYFYPNQAGSKTLVLCHGFHGAAHDLHLAALSAQSVGYNALTFDFRGCGESGGKHTSVGFWEVQDILGAIAFLKTRPEVNPSKIAIYGCSMGGATAIMAAERCSDIKAVITDCAFASLDTILNVNFRYFYHLPKFLFSMTAVWWSKRFARIVHKKIEPVESLRQMGVEGRSVPLFVIHGALDKAIPVSEATVLYDAATGPKELWIVPDARHVAAAYHDPVDFLYRINKFLTTHLD